jgi:hypothetical protein
VVCVLVIQAEGRKFDPLTREKKFLTFSLLRDKKRPSQSLKGADDKAQPQRV